MLKPARICSFALFTFFGMAVSHAQAASFDCNKARSPMEKTICADMQLSALDDELNTAYKTTLERAGNKAVIRRWQRDWLKSYTLSRCEDAACWRAQFAERIATLKNVAGRPDPAARWHGHYVRILEGREDIHPASLTLIGLSGHRILVDGHATWEGPNAANGQIHTGELAGLGRITDGQAVFDLDGCTATLTLTDTGIEVEDESGCGGLNVSFVGEYRRAD